MANAKDLETQISAALPGATVTVEDPMNDGQHLMATIIAPQFAGANRIARHRMVYAALGDAFSTNLHALKITTLAPDEA
jgi:stress-induced morphogen